MATRKELYAKIQSYELQEAAIAKYGKNYTQCNNQYLQDLIDNYEYATAVHPVGLELAFNKLVATLVSNRRLSNKDAEEILALL
jgi:hypothetical protein